jgi:hypothetical protein
LAQQFVHATEIAGVTLDEESRRLGAVREAAFPKFEQLRDDEG